MFAFPRVYSSLENPVHNFNVFAYLRPSSLSLSLLLFFLPSLHFPFPLLFHSLYLSFSLSLSVPSILRALPFCSFIIRERDESSDRMKARLFAPGNKNYHVRHKPLPLSLSFLFSSFLSLFSSLLRTFFRYLVTPVVSSHIRTHSFSSVRLCVEKQR